MSIAIANPSIVINNVAAGIVPNSCKYTEGQGESSMRVESAGGGSVQSVYSQNVATNLSKLNFSMYPTPDNIALIRSWKTNINNNGIAITSLNFSKSIAGAALTSNYEVPLGADTVIELEFMGSAAV